MIALGINSVFHDTSAALVIDGNIEVGVTPISLDLTNHSIIDELARWDWGWTAPVEISADEAPRSAGRHRG